MGRGGKGKKRSSGMDSDAGARTVYCGNLSWDVSWQDLKDFCKEIGEVEHAECLQYSDGRMSGGGIVRFARAEDAQTAINDYTDTDLKGRPIFIREDKEGGKGPGSKGFDGGKGKGKQSHKGSSSSDGGARTIYCGNLAWDVSWQDLKDFCKEIGEVEHAECLQYSDGRMTGSGIVRFARAKDARRAIEEYNDEDLKGRPIFIREDKEGGKGPGSKGFVGGKGKGKETLSDDMAERQVYVGNLSYRTSWQDLKDHMAEIGEVEYCDVMLNRDGDKAGYGLVRYKNKKHAWRAIEMGDDSELDGRKLFIREDKEGFAIKGSSDGKKGKGKGKKGKGKNRRDRSRSRSRRR